MLVVWNIRLMLRDAVFSRSWFRGLRLMRKDRTKSSNVITLNVEKCYDKYNKSTGENHGIQRPKIRTLSLQRWGHRRGCLFRFVGTFQDRRDHHSHSISCDHPRLGIGALGLRDLLDRIPGERSLKTSIVMFLMREVLESKS